jgi:hypothetical protein
VPDRPGEFIIRGYAVMLAVNVETDVATVVHHAPFNAVEPAFAARGRQDAETQPLVPFLLRCWSSLVACRFYWLEKGDRVEEADWTTNNLSMLSVETQFHWLTGMSGDGRTQLAYGFGLGVAKVSGEFKKYDLNVAECDDWSPVDRLSTDAALLDKCFTATGDPAWLLDGAGNPKVVVEDKIPPVVPVLSASIGLRQEISENAVLGLDMGIRAPQGLFVGLSAGYQWPQGK